MKKKQKKFLPVLALILALASLAVSGMTLATRPEDQSHLVDDLYQQNRELRQQITQLEERLDQFMTVTSLQDWTLEAAAWTDCTGADVAFTAVPTEYHPGMGAELLVMLGGRQVASVPCVWDGSAFMATASLDAADGYSYFCLLSGPTGVQQLLLVGPDSPEPQLPVYLESALSAYCNLVVRDWVQQSSAVVSITDAYAQVQLPLIRSKELTIVSQELVLQHNGQMTVRVPIQLTASEVPGSFETTITDLHLPMPELEEGEQLILFLEIMLSDGRRLQSFGISWDLRDGKVVASVG